MTVADSLGFARAKVNLTLHVTGRRPDGYHLLDSLVCFADVGDTVSAHPAPDWGLTVTGPKAAGVPVDDSNLVLRAARSVTDTPHHLTLDKHLPAAAGIGGGSADAAATIRILGSDGQGAEALGADVPVCLAGPGPVRMRGVGDVLDPVQNLPPLWMVLVNPGVDVPTPAVFAALAARDGAPMPEALPHWPTAGTLIAWLKRQRNDLLAPARRIAPVIDDVLAALSPAPFAAMSGSGATCFGLCMTGRAARDLGAAITTAQPDWWVSHAPVARRAV